MGISGIGIGPLFIILVIVLVLFGTKRLKNAGGDIGSAIKNFKKAVKDEDQSVENTADSGTVIEQKVEDKEKV